MRKSKSKYDLIIQNIKKFFYNVYNKFREMIFRFLFTFLTSRKRLGHLGDLTHQGDY